MTLKFNRRAMILAAASTLVSASSLSAASHAPKIVEMLSKDPNSKARNVFSPRLLVVEPGQSVLFQATDRGHNSVSIDGMIPDGASAWKGKIGKDIEVTFDVPGFYGYACAPHAGLGMVGLVVVNGDGMKANLDAARDVRQRGKAKATFDDIWSEAAAQGLL